MSQINEYSDPSIVGRYQSVYGSQMMTIRQEDGETVLTEDL